MRRVDACTTASWCRRSTVDRAPCRNTLRRALSFARASSRPRVQDLEKKEAVADKKLEVVSSQLSQARSQLNAAELSVSTLEAQLQQTQAELKAVQGGRDPVFRAAVCFALATRLWTTASEPIGGLQMNATAW